MMLKQPFAGPFLAGMEVASHSSNTLNVSKFDQVNVESTAVK
jgi:hypothetical protein